MTKEQKDTANWLLQQICVSHIQAIEIPDENFVNKMLSCSVFVCFDGFEILQIYENTLSGNYNTLMLLELVKIIILLFIFDYIWCAQALKW